MGVLQQLEGNADRHLLVGLAVDKAHGAIEHDRLVEQAQGRAGRNETRMGDLRRPAVMAGPLEARCGDQGFALFRRGAWKAKTV